MKHLYIPVLNKFCCMWENMLVPLDICEEICSLQMIFDMELVIWPKNITSGKMKGSSLKWNVRSMTNAGDKKKITDWSCLC